VRDIEGTVSVQFESPPRNLSRWIGNIR